MQAIDPAVRPRPYFLPADINCDELPESVRIALETLVEPAYTELVIHAPNALERSAGASLVFLLTEEVLQQFGLAREMDLLQTGASGDRAARQKAIDQHLRVIGAKQKAAGFLARLQAVRVAPPSE